MKELVMDVDSLSPSSHYIRKFMGSKFVSYKMKGSRLNGP